MIINVNGNLIETKYIYKISEISTRNYYSETYEPEFINLATYFSFTISFVNRKSLVINKSFSGCSKEWFYECLRNNTPELVKEKSIETSAQIIKLREQVIQYWKQDQSDIPLIDFE